MDKPKLYPSIKDYLAENSTYSVFDYVEEYGIDSWNTVIAPMINQSLKEQIWPKGAALIGMTKGSSKVVWHYRNDRYESESINEVFVIGKKQDRLITNVMQLIFTVGDKVFVEGQYGMIEGIYEHGKKEVLRKTSIGSVFSLLVKGIDLSKFDTVIL